MASWAIALIAVFGSLFLILFIVAVWVACVYNALIKKQNNVKESFSLMDICMKKRYDLIPNYVETVKGYAKHENETLEGVMRARNAAMNAPTTAEKVKGETALTRTLGRLYRVTENYPDLKANQNFLHLQGQLSSLETEISNSRKYYNGCVKDYNNLVKIFPSNLIAKRFRFEEEALFELEDVKERAVPQIKF